jgi:LysR family transcriptional regulator, glycine cleavage system transcriptional activator
MSRQLPPLNSLLAFEAAARHLSFTRAAAELHVTQSAISQQIKTLEAHLGLPLFRRLHRTLLLTDEGQRYLPALRDTFDRLDGATQRLLQRDTPERLTVSVLPSFAARWLVHRLGRFRELRPELDVLISTSLELVDFSRQAVDIAIRFGRGRYPGLRCERLLEEEVFPVCSPALLKGPHALRKPADLRHHALLHDETYGDWQRWLLAAGVTSVDARRGTTFVDSSMLVQAAVAGQGVAIARRSLAAEDLAAGRLVRVFEMSLPVEYAYYVVYPQANAEVPKIQAFRDWLHAEAARPA